MNRAEALAELKATRTLSTKLLAPLGISLESFLRLAQMPAAAVRTTTDQLIELLEQTTAADSISDEASVRGDA